MNNQSDTGTDLIKKTRDELAKEYELAESHYTDNLLDYGYGYALNKGYKAGWDERDAFANDELASMRIQVDVLTYKPKRELMEENEQLKAQIDQLKIYLTNYQNDMIEKNKQIELALKALEYFKGSEFNFIADNAIEQIQKMRGSSSGIAEKGGE